MSTEKIHRLHRVSHDKIVWCLQRRFIDYTGLVVIASLVYTERIYRLHMTSCDKLVWFLLRSFIVTQDKS